MKFNPYIHRRRSIQLKDYDYSPAGAYFVTVCVQDKECMLGKITEERTKLSSIGKIVQELWWEIPNHFNHAELDEFIVMPNHAHGIIIIKDDGRGVACYAPTKIS
jgi:REP element-mobilizing transposase RayT